MTSSATTTEDVASRALQQLREHGAWAVIRLQDSPTVTLVGGTPEHFERLGDIPLETGAPEPGRRFDRLLTVPFRQATERGFHVHDDGTPLVAVRIETETEVPLADLLAVLPDVEVEFSDRGGFETSDAAYAEVVRQIIDAEIGNGAGANMVIARNYRAQLADWGVDQALTVLRRLLERERGAYWTYCLWTGDRFLIGASPSVTSRYTAGTYG